MKLGDTAEALRDALDALSRALVGRDAGAIEDAARKAGTCLTALERQPPPPAALAELAQLNHRAGALIAARQAAVHWALSRLSPDATPLYDAAGQPSSARSRRRIASA